MVLAHAEASSHGGWADVAVRLGPLVPVALVVVWAFAAWVLARGDDRRQVRLGAAVAVAAAGLLHVLVIREHLRENTLEGLFFIGTAVVQIVLAFIAAERRQRDWSLVGIVVVDVGLIALYAASRLASLPFGIERESWDALGLITKLFEFVAAALAAGALVAAPAWRVRVDWQAVAAGALVSVAVLARPLYDLGPDIGQTVVAIAAAAATVVVIGRGGRRRLTIAVRDAAAVAIVLRAPSVAPFVVGGALVVVAHEVAERVSWPVIAPLPLAALAVLELPGTEARLEIFHASHVGDAVGATFAVAVAAALAFVVWREGALGPLAAFYAAHLCLQALRLMVGRTSMEAIEVPAVSLGLLIAAAVTLTDRRVTATSLRWATAAGAAAGAADVVLRDAGVPYSPLFALAGAVAALGVVLTAAGRRGGPVDAGGLRGDVRSGASRAG